MTRRDFSAALVTLGLAGVMAAACGSGSSLSPTAPSGVAGAGSGATISGRVSGSSPALAAPTGQITTKATSSITVTVNGTTISTSVDGTGRFTLTNVPGGTVQLRFFGNGVDATITLAGVGDHDQVDIDVTLNGHDAHVDHEQRRHPEDGRTELDGAITAIDSSARTISIGTTTVSVPATANIHGGSGSLTFAALKVGQRVEVHGTLSGSMVMATEVNIEDGRD